MSVQRLVSIVVVCFSTVVSNSQASMAQRRDSISSDDTISVLRGRILKDGTGAPISGADVWLIAVDRHVLTDSTGAFRITGLQPGLQLVEVRHLGFDVTRDTVMISGEHENVRTYALTPNATRLDTVHTVSEQLRYLSPNLRGFEERRLSKQGGYFVSDSVLRRNENMSLANLVESRIPNVTTARIPRTGATVLVSGKKQCRGLLFVPNPTATGGRAESTCQQSGKPDCYVAIYLDGSPIFTAKMADNGVSPPDLGRDFQISNLAGIEYYSDGASAPSGMHSDDSGCGSLWLWTREK